MKIIIHGGFFSESDQSQEVKTAKQESLKKLLIFYKTIQLLIRLLLLFPCWKMMNCTMQVSAPRSKATELSG